MPVFASIRMSRPCRPTMPASASTSPGAPAGGTTSRAWPATRTRTAARRAFWTRFGASTPRAMQTPPARRCGRRSARFSGRARSHRLRQWLGRADRCGLARRAGARPRRPDRRPELRPARDRATGGRRAGAKIAMREDFGFDLDALEQALRNGRRCSSSPRPGTRSARHWTKPASADWPMPHKGSARSSSWTRPISNMAATRFPMRSVSSAKPACPS